MYIHRVNLEEEYQDEEEKDLVGISQESSDEMEEDEKDGVDANCDKMDLGTNVCSKTGTQDVASKCCEICSSFLSVSKSETYRTGHFLCLDCANLSKCCHFCGLVLLVSTLEFCSSGHFFCFECSKGPFTGTFYHCGGAAISPCFLFLEKCEGMMTVLSGDLFRHVAQHLIGERKRYDVRRDVMITNTQEVVTETLLKLHRRDDRLKENCTIIRCPYYKACRFCTVVAESMAPKLATLPDTWTKVKGVRVVQTGKTSFSDSKGLA